MTQTTSDAQFKDFQEKRQALIALIKRQQGVLQTLNMTGWQEKVRQLELRASADNFKILVMGEFKRGKSTFINSLLGEEILPSYATPTTAIINEVKWGEKPGATLHFLPAKNGQTQAAKEIPVDQIEQYVTIKNEEQGYGQAFTYQSPYEKVELFWPLELCRNGIEIIDSPGLNEDTERQKITLEYLSTIDAVIFVIACDFPVSTSERDAIDTVKSAGHETVFFVCNRINVIAKQEDRIRVKERCIAILAPLTKNGSQHVFFIDALGALQGRLQHNDSLVNQSNLPPLESELRSFLIHDRGRVKLMGPARGLQNAIHAARIAIPEQQKMLHTNIETLQANYAQAKQGLDALETDRRKIIAYVTSSRMQLRNEVSFAASRFYSNAANNIAGWLNTYNVKKPMGLHEVFSGKVRERVVAEVVEFLIDQVSDEFKKWQQATLEPTFVRHMSNMEQELGEKTRSFAVGLEEVRANLVAHSTLSITVDGTQTEQISSTERIGATAAGIGLGLVLGDPGLAIMGGMFGYKEMMKNILPQIAIAIATAVIFGPALIIPAMLAASLVRGLFKANAINKKIRDAVGQEYKQKLLDMQLDMAASRFYSNAANNIAGWLNTYNVKKPMGLHEGLNQALGLELQNVDEQVRPILEAKTLGQARVDQRLAEIERANNELNQIDQELGGLIGQVAIS
jgi:hypothetical protein